MILLGALLARNGKEALAIQVECVIGKRPIDMHLFCASESLAQWSQRNRGVLMAEAPLICRGIGFFFKKKCGSYQRAFRSRACRGRETVLENCACEPGNTVAFAGMRSMGAKIQGMELLK